MTSAPGRPDARSLVITGKAAAADRVAVLALARPALRAWLHSPSGSVSRASNDALSRSYNGNPLVLLRTLDPCKI
jgi:hypothetical protein